MYSLDEIWQSQDALLRLNLDKSEVYQSFISLRKRFNIPIK